MSDYPIRYELTGICMTQMRDGEFLSLDLSDLSEEELENQLKDKNTLFLKGLVLNLVASLRKVAEQYKVPEKKNRDQQLGKDPTPDDLEFDTRIYSRLTELQNKEFRKADEDREMERLAGIFFGRHFWIRKYYERTRAG